jgi:membrane-associated phospholipid phosphatase
VLAVLGFIRVAQDYLTGDPLASWDVSFALWLSGERSGAGLDLFRAVSFLGSPRVALVLAIAISVWLYRRGMVVDAVLLPLVLGGAELLNWILKLAFHRERPEVAFVHLDSYSFPSGHAMNSTAVYGALMYLALSRFGSTVRLGLAAAMATFVALVCFSRLYLGVHYLSDVLAGFAAGIFWLSISIAVLTIYGDRITRAAETLVARR